MRDGGEDRCREDALAPEGAGAGGRARVEARNLRIARALFAASLALSLLLSLVLLFQAARFRTAALVGLAALLLGGWWAGGECFRRGRSTGWLLGLATLNAIVVVPELALTALDLRYESGIQFGFPRPHQFVYFVPDEELFWKLPASRSDVNSLGFPGPEIERPKPAGTYRMLFLGDSCTQQGYPRTAELLLNADGREAVRFESVLLAISGYSSHQGRVAAERYGRDLQPDLVFVYFGWNDHWRAWGAVDATKEVEVPETGWSRWAAGLYNESRFLQGARRLLDASLGGGRSGQLGALRVPKEHYERNLRAIHSLFSEAGVPVVFVTAASSHARLGVDPRLIEIGQVPTAEFGIRIHREYNRIVRRVAAATGAGLLDLAKEFGRYDDATLRAVFVDDGIHFTPEGLGLVGERVAEAVRERAPAGHARN